MLAAPRALEQLLSLAVPGFALLDMPAWVGGAPPDPAAADRLPRGALAVNLHGRGPQSHALLRAADPARLIGFDLPGGPAWRENEHEVARWCRLLAHYGIAADPAELDLRLPDAPPSDAPPPGPGGPARPGPTLLHPGAASPARRWPPERWAQVARGERAEGREVLVSGSAAEVPLAREVAARAGLPPDAVRAGTTRDLLALARLVAGAGRVVCGDTGVAHLATALRVPSVVLFGPTDPRRWGPPPERPWHVALWAGAAGDPHAAATDAGLLEIGVDDVRAALRALSTPAPAPRRAVARPAR